MSILDWLFGGADDTAFYQQKYGHTPGERHNYGIAPDFVESVPRGPQSSGTSAGSGRYIPLTGKSSRQAPPPDATDYGSADHRLAHFRANINAALGDSEIARVSGFSVDHRRRQARFDFTTGASDPRRVQGELRRFYNTRQVTVDRYGVTIKGL